MPLICFFGSDGAGKITLARALADKFSMDGVKVEVRWMRVAAAFLTT